MVTAGRLPAILVSGLSHLDAVNLIHSWERLGSRALGELAQITSTEGRVATLEEASHSYGVSGKGTLLGALLSTRYDRRGLRDHLRQLLLRLRARLIPTFTHLTLEDALLSIVLPHAYGVISLTPEVLADAFGMTVIELRAFVLHPLGEEAAISFGAEHVVARHEMIASAIVDICLEDEIEIDRPLARVVTAAASRMTRNNYPKDLPTLAYISSRITDIEHLAVAAANAAVEGAPTRLSYYTSRSAVLRRVGRAADAAQSNADVVDLMNNAQNVTHIRAYLSEWGVAEGQIGNHARNAMLDALALQDGYALGPMKRDPLFAMSGLLVSLRRLCEARMADSLVEGLAVVCVLADQVQDPKSRGDLRAAERVVFRAGRVLPDLDDWARVERVLSRALDAISERLESPLPATLPKLARRYQSLRSVLLD